MASKYRNKKTVVDGIKFDSKAEAARYVELKGMEDGGYIAELRRQVPFLLVPKYPGQRAVKYIADFVYKQDGQQVVEDVKRVRTATYIIKKKLMWHVHGIRVQEV